MEAGIVAVREIQHPVERERVPTQAIADVAERCVEVVHVRETAVPAVVDGIYPGVPEWDWDSSGHGEIC